MSSFLRKHWVHMPKGLAERPFGVCIVGWAQIQREGKRSTTTLGEKNARGVSKLGNSGPLL